LVTFHQGKVTRPSRGHERVYALHFNFYPTKKIVIFVYTQPGYPIKKDNRAVLLKEKPDQKLAILNIVI